MVREWNGDNVETTLTHGTRIARVKYTRSRFINFAWIIIFKTTWKALCFPGQRNCLSFPFFPFLFFSPFFYFVLHESAEGGKKKKRRCISSYSRNIQWEAFVTFFSLSSGHQSEIHQSPNSRDRLSSFFSFSLARRCNSCCPWNWFLAWLVRTAGSMRVFERFDIRLYRCQVFGWIFASFFGKLRG